MDNELEYYLSKIEKQLDFHRGLHLFEMEMNSNFTNKVVFLKESQEEYITNLFGNNKNIQESYNKEFNNNVIIESTFDPKDEVKKFFSFIKENYVNQIKKTNLINEQLSKTFINEQWAKGPDPIGYWTVLFKQLKSSGIGVKYGANGKTVTDPKIATFMYWGGWVIWKDVNKNGGYPVAFTDPATKVSMIFKFQGGKYAGQPANNINLDPKTINVPFNLTQFGKLSNKQMSDTITKYKKSNPKTDNGGQQKLKLETETAAKNVFAKLKAAFDRDKDNVYDDWDGTDENGALAAIKLITTKNILDRVNQLIAASAKPYGSLKAWVNDEMSDIDRDTYKGIWDRLGKLGYKGYQQNDFLAATGKGDVVGMAKAGFTWLKDKGIPWFFEKLREALGSTAGAILQQLLDYTGIGAIGVTIMWAALTLFDVWQISSGVGSWAKIFFSIIGLLSAGALAKVIGKFLKPFFGAGGGTITSFFTKIAEKPWFIKYVKPVVGWIGSKVSWATGLLKQAGDWIVKKLGATAIGGVVTKAANFLQQIAEKIVQFAGTSAKSETKLATNLGIKKLGADEVKKEAGKIVDKVVKDKVKDYGKETVVGTAGYVGGEKAKLGVELGYGVKDFKKSSGDLNKALNKGDLVKSVEKTYGTVDKFGKVIDKGTQLASNEPVNPSKIVGNAKQGLNKVTQNLG